MVFIPQVEVYSNSTELWLKRQSLLMEMYASPSDVDTEPFEHVSQSDDKEEGVHNELESSNESLGWFQWVFHDKLEGVQVLKEEFFNSSHDSDEDKNVSSFPEQYSLYELFDIYSK